MASEVEEAGAAVSTGSGLIPAGSRMPICASEDANRRSQASATASADANR
jgi:hypothetical protein